jgi:hypothetical protein
VNRRTLLIFILTIIVLGTIVIANRPSPDNEAVAVLPGLDNGLNDVTTLTIRTAGNRTVATLMRGTERWTIAERGNYPADVGKIRQNLIALAKATVVEQKTADPTLYPRLGVEDISNEGATGVELVIDSPDESFRIIIGKTGIRGDQAYARIPGSTGSLLIAAKLDLGQETIDWLNPAIIDIPSSEVSRVTTTHPDGETIRIRNTEAGGFEPVDLPADVKITATGVAESIGAVLADLRLVDVSTRANAGLEDVEPIVSRFETRDGLTVITRVYTDGDEQFVGFEFTAGADAVAAEESTDEATARATELQARFGKWLFVLADNKVDQLTHHHSDLFEISD